MKNSSYNEKNFKCFLRVKTRTLTQILQNHFSKILTKMELGDLPTPT